MRDLPAYSELMLPVLTAVARLGGSGSNREISAAVVEAEGYSEDLVGISYEGRDQSILMDRLDWARSYCKLGGALESPKRGLFLLSELGREILALEEAEARLRLQELDKAVRRARIRKSTAKSEATDQPDLRGIVDTDSDADQNEGKWREVLLSRLHSMSPEAFERFVMYLLRSFGMELLRVGGSGDEGVDGIGTAPLTDVLSTTVAVQAKRYEPTKSIGRETVALFQSDATAAGAEHGVLVTTARFSEPARRAALGRHPTIDLVDGEKLADLCLKQEAGVVVRPLVQESWFDRFEE